MRVGAGHGKTNCRRVTCHSIPCRVWDHGGVGEVWDGARSSLVGGIVVVIITLAATRICHALALVWPFIVSAIARVIARWRNRVLSELLGVVIVTSALRRHAPRTIELRRWGVHIIEAACSDGMIAVVLGVRVVS